MINILSGCSLLEALQKVDDKPEAFRYCEKKEFKNVRSGPERVLTSSRGEYLVQVLGGRQLLALRNASAAATETLLASLA